jgi:hypothetical protein
VIVGILALLLLLIHIQGMLLSNRVSHLEGVLEAMNPKRGWPPLPLPVPPHPAPPAPHPSTDSGYRTRTAGPRDTLDPVSSPPPPPPNGKRKKGAA